MFLHLSVSHSVHSVHRSGRYTSYRNACLLLVISLLPSILRSLFFLDRALLAGQFVLFIHSVQKCPLKHYLARSFYVGIPLHFLYHTKYGVSVSLSVSDVHSKFLDARARLNFHHFHAVCGKFWPNNRLAPPYGLASPSGKSWIRHRSLSF